MCGKDLNTWLRWFSLKTVLWRQLGRAMYDVIQSSGSFGVVRCANRDHAKSRLFISLTKLNLIEIYEMLEDFIRFPPY